MGATDKASHRIVGSSGDPEQSVSTRDIAGIALAGIAAVAFGTLAISAKFAYRVGSPVLPLLTVRFIGATLLIALFHLLTRRSLMVRRGVMWRLLVLGGVGYGLETALFFGALQRAPAGVVALIFYSYPLWTVLVGFATRLEPFRWKLVAALVVGSIGVAIVFTPEHGGLAGPLFALAAAVTVALYFILMQLVLRDVEASPAAFWTSAGAAITTALTWLVFRDPLPSGAVIPALALAGASAFAFITLYAAITRIGSSRASVAAMVEPIATIVLAAVLLDERITTRVLIGAAFVVSALPMLALAGKKDVPAADSL
ncbi:MAG: DMT family transporter [Actinobacteria bacterium]|nr:DMT family transporter [Actinomycetota bacterium]